jgi:hypothetical protein
MIDGCGCDLLISVILTILVRPQAAPLPTLSFALSSLLRCSYVSMPYLS